MRDVLTGALAHEIDLEVVTTTHRGHAQELGRRARVEHFDLVITLGGDGTINETVNGLLDAGPDPNLPILATIPGGSANVLARALGFPNDPIEATGLVLESLRSSSTHDIGLGRVEFTPLPDSAAPPFAGPMLDAPLVDKAPVLDVQAESPRSAAPESVVHWFTINAGLGLDADVIRAMEEQRASGYTATGPRYLMTALRQYAKDSDEDTPRLRILRPGVPDITGIVWAIVQNTAPWTYLGPVPINPCPQASFDVGLDVFAPHSLGFWSAARLGSRMVRGSRMGPIKGELTLLHDQPGFDIVSDRPIALQVDGDSMGMVTRAQFLSVAHALRITG